MQVGVVGWSRVGRMTVRGVGLCSIISQYPSVRQRREGCDISMPREKQNYRAHDTGLSLADMSRTEHDCPYIGP